jgi:short-subunit dehydrogenase
MIGLVWLNRLHVGKKLESGTLTSQTPLHVQRSCSVHVSNSHEQMSEHSGNAIALCAIDVVVLAFGVLGDQARAESDVQHTVNVIHTDYVAQVSVLTHLAQLLRAQGSGRIVMFSSVAGIRVRRANCVYGSAKAGLDGFASGLGDALHGSDVSLLLVQSGFVIGWMTEGMSPAPMSSTPGQVAAGVVKALGKSRERVSVPGLTRPAFFALRLLPKEFGVGCRDKRTRGSRRSFLSAD